MISEELGGMMMDESMAEGRKLEAILLSHAIGILRRVIRHVEHVGRCAASGSTVSAVWA